MAPERTVTTHVSGWRCAGIRAPGAMRTRRTYGAGATSVPIAHAAFNPLTLGTSVHFSLSGSKVTGGGFFRGTTYCTARAGATMAPKMIRTEPSSLREPKETSRRGTKPAGVRSFRGRGGD